jgi:hypothetical protein
MSPAGLLVSIFMGWVESLTIEAQPVVAMIPLPYS